MILHLECSILLQVLFWFQVLLHRLLLCQRRHLGSGAAPASKADAYAEACTKSWKGSVDHLHTRQTVGGGGGSATGSSITKHYTPDIGLATIGMGSFAMQHAAGARAAARHGLPVGGNAGQHFLRRAVLVAATMAALQTLSILICSFIQ